MVPVVLSWSGGKDSTLALRELRRSADIEVVALLTTITREHDRISMHGVRRALLEAQAESLGLPLWTVEIGTGAGNDEYEAEFRRALETLAGAHDVHSVAFGDLFLEDIRRYREELAERAGYRALFPVWGRDTGSLAREFIDLGHRAVLTCVDTAALDGSFAGRTYDAALLRDLPPSVDPCGENGEFHTFVASGPGFAREVSIRTGDRVLRDDRFMFCDLVGPGARRAADP
jgi:uncharacterized protein (TIGR00290 family)